MASLKTYQCVAYSYCYVRRMWSTITGFSFIVIGTIPTSTTTVWLIAVTAAAWYIASCHCSSVAHSMCHLIPSGDQHPSPFEVPACAHNKAVHTIKCGRGSTVHVVWQLHVLYTIIRDPKWCKDVGEFIWRKNLWFIIRCNTGFTLVEEYDTVSHELVGICAKRELNICLMCEFTTYISHIWPIFSKWKSTSTKRNCDWKRTDICGNFGPYEFKLS